MAVALAGAVIAGSLVTRGGDGDRSTTEVPPSTTTTTVAAAPGAGSRPERVLVASGEGDLQVLDVATGEVVAELGSHPPTATEAGPSFVDTVAITPDGTTAYVDVCCEPACGHIVRLPTDGSVSYPDFEEPLVGWTPRPSPDGRSLAKDTCRGVVVDDHGPVPHRRGEPVDGLSWSPDGRRLAWAVMDGTSVVIADVVGGGTLAVSERVDPPDGATWRQPAIRADGEIVVVERDGDDDRGRVIGGPTFSYDGEVVAQGYDPSGRWLLVLYVGGRLVGMGGGDTFEVATDIAAADW